MMHNGALEPIPAEGWLHPGASAIQHVEEVHGRPALAPEFILESYFGWSGAFLYKVDCRLWPTNLTGWTVEWQFEDGAVVPGPECSRVVVGGPPMNVTVVARKGSDAVRVAHRLSFYGAPPPEAGNAAQAGKRYLGLLVKEDPAHLSAAALAGVLPVLIDFGENAQIAPFADAWLKLKPNLADPLWLPAELARLRSLAQKDPRAALAELHNVRQTATRYAGPLDLFELELLVFYLRDPSAESRAQQIAFGSPGTPEARLATIRRGDFYRLTGKADAAAAQYQAAQPPDESGGRKLPAQDQAYSMTIQDLIEKGDRDDAAAKLQEWELNHPMAKFATDFLLLRSRVLMLFGRWSEALAELEAFAATHPDSPYQIDADYYRARALYELGNKDDARKIWLKIVKDYPKSELAEPSKQWAAKP